MITHLPDDAGVTHNLKNRRLTAMLNGQLISCESQVPLLILFIVVPIVELYFLIKVGSIIGVVPTILIVIATAAIGTALLRQQGLATLHRYQQSLSSGRLPAQEMIEGLALVFGGALLLTPGFVTDIIGFLCLIPFTRQVVIRWLLKRVRIKGATMMSQRNQWGEGFDDAEQPKARRTIEGEFKSKDE